MEFVDMEMGLLNFFSYICCFNSPKMKRFHIVVFVAFAFSLLVFAQERGMASYYSHRLTGRHTSDGGKYHPDSLTCAHKTYPFGTLLLVRNPVNDYEVIVKVTDRGPHTRNRLIDVSYLAAKRLDIISKGIAQVEVSVIDKLPDELRLLPIPKVYIAVKELEFLNTDLQYKLRHLVKHKAKKRLKSK